MDERLGQADPAAQRRGQSARLEVLSQQRQQLLRAACAYRASAAALMRLTRNRPRAASVRGLRAARLS